MRLALACIALAVPATASAQTYTINPTDDLFARLRNLQAGDEVIVNAGTYTTTGLLQVTWAGTPQQPIIVRGADGARPIIQGTPNQNVIDLGGSYWTLKNFEIRGGSHGVRLAASDHAVLEDLVLHSLGDVGISCNRPGQDCYQMTIRHNEIYNTGLSSTGEGMYLGGNDATNIFRDSIVERNYIHDMGGSQGDGIEIKTGATGVIVRDNVIIRAKYPAITMYGYAGSGAQNIVERNYIHTTVDNGIQIVGQVIVRNNIVLAAGANGIQSKPSQAETPKDLVIAHNTIVGSGGPCLKSNDWATAQNQRVTNNALYCTGGTAIDLNGGAPNATLANNIGLGTSNAPMGFRAGTSVAADLGTAMKVYPPAGSMLINAGITTNPVIEDFNGMVRGDGMPDVGAYEHTATTNPGWDPQEGFKTETPVNGADNSMPMNVECIDFCGPPAESDSGCCSASTSPAASTLLTMLVGLALLRRRIQSRR
ncbi:MAG: right-handed parallel beta-helix repeat-containing protein [Deltaproteobacteria bacterium]|nr:right-handed parallel beta-helix repeat-containing protein [Deltaproteobacteria bacterium]